MSVQELYTSTYWYVQVRKLNKTCGFLIHPGSALRVKYNSVQHLRKRYDRRMSTFKKCKVQVMQVHIGTYWHVLVRTCIDINHKHASMESRSIYSPTPTSRHCTLDLFLAQCLSSGADSSTVRPPRCGFGIINSQFLPVHASTY
jgi:hypothetical protein